jgi:hypothetical protein
MIAAPDGATITGGEMKLSFWRKVKQLTARLQIYFFLQTHIKIGNVYKLSPCRQQPSLHSASLKSFVKIHGWVEGESVVAIVSIVQETVEVKVLEDISGVESAEVKAERFVRSVKVTKRPRTGGGVTRWWWWLLLLLLLLRRRWVAGWSGI